MLWWWRWMEWCVTPVCITLKWTLARWRVFMKSKSHWVTRTLEYIQDDPSLISPSKLCNAILVIGLNAEVQGAVETGTATSCKTGSQQEQGKLRINDLLGREKRAWYTLLALAQFPQNFGNFRKNLLCCTNLYKECGLMWKMPATDHTVWMMTRE